MIYPQSTLTIAKNGHKYSPQKLNFSKIYGVITEHELQNVEWSIKFPTKQDGDDALLTFRKN